MGLFIMVEFHLLPACGVMALFTLPPVASMVHIVKLMAGNALHRCFGIVFADMAARAIGFTMLTCEGELGLVVVVMDFAPMVLVVAACALVINLAHARGLMRRFLGMTAVTALRRLPVFLASLMTLGARNLSVLPMQGKIC
jgi:hypothetical protein